MKNGTDVELAGVHSDQALAVLIKHEGGRLDIKSEASFQVALLYTTATGQRRVRVHNYCVPITFVMGDLFRAADMDTTVNFLARAVALHALSKPLKEVRDVLTERCIMILSAYRHHCASSTAPGQLILPEALKLLPLYTLTMLKSKLLRPGRDINSDVRVHHMRMIRSMGVSESIVYFYPRLFSIVGRHLLDSDFGRILDDHVDDNNDSQWNHQYPPHHQYSRTKSGRVGLSTRVRTSYTRLNPRSAYLLENGQQLYLWFGREVEEEILQELFGVSLLEQLDTATMNCLPELSNEYSQRVRNVLSYIQSQRGKHLGLTIVRQGLDPTEAEFSQLLVEDENNENMSYVDYLCTVHRMIQADVASAKTAGSRD
ncbi:COPII coat Sec23p-Sfb3p heterodimer component [Podila epigama]|nr:COPII coat Sec23p-Sfb3p heterodimer component [Podila epigama]